MLGGAAALVTSGRRFELIVAQYQCRTKRVSLVRVAALGMAREKRVNCTNAVSASWPPRKPAPVPALPCAWLLLPCVHAPSRLAPKLRPLLFSGSLLRRRGAKLPPVPGPRAVGASASACFRRFSSSALCLASAFVRCSSASCRAFASSIIRRSSGDRTSRSTPLRSFDSSPLSSRGRLGRQPQDDARSANRHIDVVRRLIGNRVTAPFGIMLERRNWNIEKLEDGGGVPPTACSRARKDLNSNWQYLLPTDLGVIRGMKKTDCAYRA